MHTAQSLTQNELMRTMQGQGNYKESSFVVAKATSPRDHAEEDGEDSFFQEERGGKDSRLVVNMSHPKKQQEVSSFTIKEEAKESVTPHFERKQFSESKKVEASKFEENEAEIHDIRI